MSIETGAVSLIEIIKYCAEIGLYKSNVTLYIIGAALRWFLKENAVFYDGCAYLRYMEVRDISTWIITLYENLERRRHRERREAVLFFDCTSLKQRMEYVFGIKPHWDKSFDTLGMTRLQINQWVVENLRYPIAFLDDTLYRFLSDRKLYGEALLRYDAYFAAERCEWLKARIRQSDIFARAVIKNTVGFDPDVTPHGMSNLPKGHYAPALYSAESYIREMCRKPVRA